MLWETFHNVFLSETDYQTQCIIFSFLREIRIRILLGHATHFPAGAQSKFTFSMIPDSLPQRSQEIHSSSSRPRSFWEGPGTLGSVTNLTCLFFPQRPCFASATAPKSCGSPPVAVWGSSSLSRPLAPSRPPSLAVPTA